MNKVNPSFILRNYLMQEAIELAEKESDFSKVNDLLDQARRPFDERSGEAKKSMCMVKPTWAYDLCVSCSS